MFYTIFFIVGTCHAQTVTQTPALLALCLVMVTLSGVCSLCSVIMLVGLYRDNRLLLLPWTLAISTTTLIDVMISFYLIKDADKNPFLAVFFVTDVLICALNVYALLCVLSQYQEYKTGAIGKYIAQPRSQTTSKQPPTKAHVTSSVTDDITSSNTFLLPPSPMKTSSATGNAIPMKLAYCELTTISEEKFPGDASRAVTPAPNQGSPNTDNKNSQTCETSLIQVAEEVRTNETSQPVLSCVS